MTDDNKNSVQRFSRRNRKNRLPRSQGLFPLDDDDTPVDDASDAKADEAEAGAAEDANEVEDTPLPASEYQAPDFDLDALDALGSDDDALATLSSLSKDEVRAPVIAPQAERYPPINPDTNIKEQPPQPSAEAVAAAKANSRRNLRNNIITLVAILGMLGVIAWTAMVWVNPQTAMNPFPPQTPFVVVTATMGAADTANTDSGMPTANADGQIFIVATEAATATTQATESPYAFIVPDEVLYVPNGNDLGCNWWSIAGTVTNADGEPINGYRVRVTGDDVDETVFSGTIQTFGAGGFELPLIGTPQIADFTVQLFSPQDAPLSQPVPVVTRADCEGNVAIINFVQNR